MEISVDSMNIVIDDREDKTRILNLKEAFSAHNCSVSRLKAGDILIERSGYPDILIETKTIQDFISSCKNRQIQKEALQMTEQTSFSYIIVYDDGKYNSYYNRISKNSIYGNYASLTIRYKVPIFMAKNFKDFTTCITAIVNNVNKSTIPIEPPIVRPKNSNPFINILIGLEDVGPKTARNLLNTFKKPSKVLTATEEELDSVPFRLSKKAKRAILRS